MNKKNHETPSVDAVQFEVEDIVRTSNTENITKPGKTDGEFILEDIFYGQN